MSPGYATMPMSPRPHLATLLLLNMPKYLFYRDLILQTISSLSSDLEIDLELAQFWFSRGSSILKLPVCQNICLVFNNIKNS